MTMTKYYFIYKEYSLRNVDPHRCRPSKGTGMRRESIRPIHTLSKILKPIPKIYTNIQCGFGNNILDINYMKLKSLEKKI